MFGNSVSREQYEDMKARAEKAEARCDALDARVVKLTDTIVSLRRKHGMDVAVPPKASYVPDSKRRSDGEIIAAREKVFVDNLVADLVAAGHERPAAEKEAMRLRRAAVGPVEQGD